VRLRVLVIGIGFLIVVALYTFPLWQRFVIATPETVEILFPGLPLSQQAAFASLPPDQQRTYLELAEADPQRALQLVQAAFGARLALPEDDQRLPRLNAPQPIAAGRFTALDPVRWAQGLVTVLQDADGRLLVRFEDFSMLNTPDARVALSPAENPLTVEEMSVGTTNFYEVGTLLATLGAQNYPLPANFNAAPYRSVVIFSRALNLVYSVAPLALRQ
jgi:hypothetical protein